MDSNFEMAIVKTVKIDTMIELSKNDIINYIINCEDNNILCSLKDIVKKRIIIL